MATYQFTGDQETVFPSLGVTVQPGDTFDAPDGIVASNLTLASATKKSTPAPSAPTTSSAASDTTQGA
jgi:hypothetical protein